MKLSTISTAIILAVASTDILKIDDDKLEFSALIPVSTKDTFTFQGVEQTITRSHNAEPHVVVPLGLLAGEVDPDFVKQSYVDGTVMNVTVSGATIRESSISGNSYEAVTPA